MRDHRRPIEEVAAASDAAPSPAPTATITEETRYRTLFERAPVGIVYADAQSYYLDANECICKMLGYSREELIGLHASDIVAPAEVKHIRPALNDIDRTDGHRREWRFRRKDGSNFTAQVIATKFPDGTLLGMIQDVTALKEREREIARMSRLYSALSQINQSIVWSNSRDELFGRVCQVLVDYGGFCMAWIDCYDAVAGKLVKMAGYREQQPIERGGNADLPCTAFPIRAGGAVFGTLNVCAHEEDFFQDKEMTLLEEAATDVSFALDNFARDEARSLAEQKLRSEKLFSDTMIDSMPGVLYFYDATGRFLRWNRNFEVVCGYSAQEIARMHPLDFFSDHDKPLLESRIDEVFAKGESSVEASFVSKNGTPTPYFFTGRRVQLDGLTCLVGVGIDITDRRRLEEQFRQAQKMEAIGQLAGGVAHDFNNILAIILGNAELAMADMPADHPMHEGLEGIVKAAERAASLVQQILAFARQQPRDMQVVDLAPTLQEACAFLRATIPSVAELVLTTDPGAPPVLADTTQVYQVIANLCTNAWHALEGKPGRIEVKLEQAVLDSAAAGRITNLRPGRFACLSVCDNGKGMDASVLTRIFDPFFTTKEPGKGTGLGLSVVHGIMQGHHGAIAVSSQPGQGSTFRAYFPAAEMPA